MKNFDYDQLSPNIRRVVGQLHDWGYETSDSGDGSQHADGMECAVPFPMVYIALRTGFTITNQADNLCERLTQAGVLMGDSFGKDPSDVRRVEVMYSTADGHYGLCLIGVRDSDFDGKWRAPEMVRDKG